MNRYLIVFFSSLILGVVLFTSSPLKAYADVVVPGQPYVFNGGPCGFAGVRPCNETEWQYILKDKFQKFTVEVYAINLFIELAVAAGFFLFLKKLNWRTILAVCIVNLISLPLLYLLLHNQNTYMSFALGEVAVWIFETIGIFYISKRALSWKQSLTASTLTNGTTLAVSLLLWLR